MLELSQITKTYPHAEQPVCALDDVSVEVEAGEFVAVRGPSGCGKTTLLLTAGALLAPSAGCVRVNGQDIYNLAPDARAAFRAANIGFVFQQFHLVSYLNVRENILAAALASSHERGGEIADELIEKTKLTWTAASTDGWHRSLFLRSAIERMVVDVLEDFGAVSCQYHARSDLDGLKDLHAFEITPLGAALLDSLLIRE